MERKVAFLIATAQRASDFGKFDRLDHDDQAASNVLGQLIGKAADELCRYWEYALKDVCVRKAIHRIKSNPNSEFHFRVTPSEMVGPKYVVYFDFKVEGKRRQVSFHSFDGKLARFVERKPTGHWDRKSSRQACIDLLRSL